MSEVLAVRFNRFDADGEGVFLTGARCRPRIIRQRVRRLISIERVEDIANVDGNVSTAADNSNLRSGDNAANDEFLFFVIVPLSQRPSPTNRSTSTADKRGVMTKANCKWLWSAIA